MELNRAQRGGFRSMALLIDCDNFKAINDTWGYAVGDRALREIASRLRNALRTIDHLARIGGDEFLAILPDTRLAEANRVANRLATEVSSRPILVIDEPIPVTVSIGVVNLPQHVSSMEEILALSHEKLKEAKELNKTGAGEHDEVSYQRLLKSLETGEGLQVLFQSIFRLADGQEVARELLIRSQPGTALEIPNSLFDVYFQQNLLCFADVSCLRKCISSTAQSDFEGRFHLNIHPTTLLRTPNQILALFEARRSEMLGNRFCLEISEQQFIGDPVRLRESVAALREVGIQISLDHLGFGKGSMEALLVLEPEFVKVDRVWIDGIAEDKFKSQSLQRMLRVVESLEATLIAEGIEKYEDLEFLNKIGVRFGQGFYWGKPQTLRMQATR